MSALVLESVVVAKKIHAIKALRAVTGWGLKESKDLIDRVAAGETVTIDETASFRIDDKTIPRLEANFVTCRVKGGRIAVGDFVSTLQRFPRETTVGALLEILEPTRSMLDNEELIA